MTLPKHLYHYTSQKGLLGILKSKKLWMTHILYLNDSSEFTHTLDLVKSELSKRRNELVNHLLKLIDDTFRTYDVIEKLCNNFQNNTKYISYVFSLSEKEDDINQWKGYSPGESGFCIGFDTHKLSSIIRKRNVSKIKKCIYKQKEKEKIVKTMLDNIPDLFKSNQSSDIIDASTSIYVETIFMSSYIKDESFIDEKEYRIIYHHKDKKMEHREGKSMIIPYIEFPPGDVHILPISKIVIGPTPHPELSMMSVDSLLVSNGYDDIEVVKSKIPYRSW
jgi:hypothetical protein